MGRAIDMEKDISKLKIEIERKKPTIKELASQLEIVNQDMDIAKMRIINLENLLVKYFEYNKDDKKFKKYLDKETEKLNKDRAKDNPSDNKRKSISKSK